MQLLNSYLDDLAKGRTSTSRATKLVFHVKDGVSLRRVEATLPASGNLLPLFYAFGLITADELTADSSFSAAADTDFLVWLQGQVQEAVRAAEQHDLLKGAIRKLRGGIEERLSLAEVLVSRVAHHTGRTVQLPKHPPLMSGPPPPTNAAQVGAEYAVSLAEQERQLETLKVLEGCLLGLSQQGYDFSGLSFQLYHPHSCPVESTSYVDEHGFYNMKTSYMRSFIADDGCVHLVADRMSIKQQVMSVDLERARMLTKVTFFWLKRVRDLTPVLIDLLGVKNVWSDVKSEQSSQKFVIWAGYLLEKR